MNSFERGCHSMRQLPQVSLSSVVSRPGKRLGLVLGRLPRLLAIPVLLLAVVFAGVGLGAQTVNQVTRAVDTSQVRALPNHLPLWAKPANNAGLVPADQALDQMTIVLARSPQQEQAFDQFLADQQNPASPNYHHWLTPAEVGQRFGLSDQDIASVTGWLQSQGLHVNWVSPSRIFIGFGGTAADIGRAFQTEMRYYKVNGVQRMSVSSDPMIPEALLPAIKAVRGLYTIEEKPQVHAGTAQSASPQETTFGGSHYLSPADFATVYDLPSSFTGAGITIGIVGRSRVNPADLDNFTSKTGVPSITSRLTTVVPPNTTDPGSPLTNCAAAPCNVPEDQLEATLDVMRAGSVAPGASLLLAVDTSGSGGDIGADATYLVETSPTRPQVISISFGLCESTAGSSGVNYWDSLFKTAAGEGISVFVSSDDAGAAGCDASFAAPPANPSANSPNYICSSSYATCVGGTEFADWTSPSNFWSSANGANLSSVLSYIPEGAWNEPLDSNSSPQVASSGGGVSNIIATPSWQTGTGVPAARAGRYTPDIAFSASGHDGYFGCLAAGATGNNSSCVTVNGSFGFEYFSGTSAAAPGMAGITAMLDQKLGSAQGNLNPSLYSMAASVPAAFHDVTVATSGVSNCNASTPSMCNNSIPSATTGGAAQTGYLVGTGYDEVTGLGSLDVNTFISNYAAASSAQAPTATTGTATSVTATTATLAASVNPDGADTSVSFLWGTSSTLTGASSTTAQDLGSGTTSVPATANLTGLTAGTKYYFQVVAKNSVGTTDGTIATFTTTGGVVAGTFAISGTPVTVAAGATTGNTSTITVTPTGGFTGSVTLTAAVTSSPANAVQPPTFNFGSTSPLTISGTTAGTATLTVSTTASQTTQCTADNRMQHGIPWYAAGGTALACMLLFGLPGRRRKGRTMLGLVVLLASLSSGVLACGGGGGGSNNNTCTPTTTPGTTAGTYTVTVTGTSGSMTPVTGTFTLTVQ
jgi:subtilase family serine protease